MDNDKEEGSCYMDEDELEDRGYQQSGLEFTKQELEEMDELDWWYEP